MVANSEIWVKISLLIMGDVFGATQKILSEASVRP